MARARAFTSAPGVGTVLLPAITGGTGRTLATGVSKGGGRVVGSGATPATELAVIWDTQTGTHQTLGTLAGGTYSLGLAISANGSVAAGEASIVGGAVRTFRWTAAGMEDIGVVPSALFMFCGDLSADGNAIVGTAIRAAGASAYLYLNVGGQGGVIAIPNLFGATSSGATGVSGDGSIIVGKATVPGVGGGSGDRATLYTSELGTVDLNAYFSTLGVDLTGWRLTEAAAISDDGRAVVGNGFLNNTPAAWIVRGLTGCTPEVSNSSGTVQTCAGGDAEFFVSLLPGGGGPVTFAWRVDGLLIDPLVNPSAATNRLVIRGVTTEDSGVYDCVITNSCGSTFSEAFSLSVLPSNHPMCCSADFNADGEVNADDLGDYINCYFQNFIAPGACPAADVNTDGEINGDDLGDYINTYFGPPC